MVEVVEILVHEVELLEVKELERNLQIARLVVLPSPQQGPVAQKGHVRRNPVSKLRFGAYPEEILLKDQSDEHHPETEFKTAVPESRGEKSGDHGLDLHLAPGYFPVHERHHDVVLEPVVHRGIPACDGLVPVSLQLDLHETDISN